MRHAAWVVLLTFACAACGTPVSSAPTAPRDAVDLGSTSAALDTADLAEGATDPDRLLALLNEQGFESASVRTWTGRAIDDLRHVEARSLRFGSAAGAAAYLDWVRAHPEDLVGTAEIVAERPYLLVRHVPGGCCPNKDVRQMLAAWTDGDVAWVVALTGPGATPVVATALAHTIDRAQEGSETDAT